MLLAGVVTVSDRSSQGLRADSSGPELTSLLELHGIKVVWSEVVPDEESDIRSALTRLADEQGLDLVVTTGGTGVSPRDVTPEATAAVLDRTIPGMAEAMRAASLAKTPHAMLSRALAGVRGKTLIINVPGSPKGAVENLQVVLPAVEHAAAKIKGDPSDCA
jgi:molybdopterin adenylyltransferase